MKYPSYAIKEIFYKITNKTGPSSSHNFLYKADCPLCSDKRQRMYLKDYGDEYMVFCHNCGYSNSFISMLYSYFPSEISYLQQFVWDSIKDGKAFERIKKEKRAKNKLKPFDYMDSKLRMYRKTRGFSILEEQENKKYEKYRRFCFQYFQERRLPEDFISDLYCMTKGTLQGYVAIPFWDRKKDNLIHLQGRRMFEPKTAEEKRRNPKYKFLKDEKNDIEIEDKPLWGLHRIDLKSTVFIVEGTLDALCFMNGCATCGATVSQQFIMDIKKSFPNHIWVSDNIWVDEASRVLVEKLLLAGERCFIFPESVKQKDPNSYIIDNKLDYIPDDLIQDNIYEGKLGLAELKTKIWGKGITWQRKKRQNGKYQKS